MTAQTQANIGVGTMEHLGTWRHGDWQLDMWDTGTTVFGDLHSVVGNPNPLIAYKLRYRERECLIFEGHSYRPGAYIDPPSDECAGGLIGFFANDATEMRFAGDPDEYVARFGTARDPYPYQLRTHAELLMEHADELALWANDLEGVED